MTSYSEILPSEHREKDSIKEALSRYQAAEYRRDERRRIWKGVFLALAIIALFLLAVLAADAQTGAPAITIHVHDYAGVSPQTLAEAEKVAAGIFDEAGVRTGWVNVALTMENVQAKPADGAVFTLADIQLSILSQEMADRDGAPNDALGVAPGSGPDRRTVYIFESNVDARYWSLSQAKGSAGSYRRVCKAQILGHAMAHEIGHVLLNQQVHSALGIMRGGWDAGDFRDMTEGRLNFSPQQAEFLRADVRRRNSQRETLISESQ